MWCCIHRRSAPGLACVALVAALAMLPASCSEPAHIRSYRPKRRIWKPPVPIAQDGMRRSSPASLWPEDGRSRVVDWGDRPSRTGDMVNVQIDEYLAAKGGATTDLKRESEYEAKIRALLGMLKKAKQYAGLSEEMIGASLKHDFQGSGKTSRENRVVATIPAIVTQVLSNGNLFIEGHRVILLNQEENHFYLSGLIRPIDIDAGNIILSSRIADAQIEVTGRGLVTEMNQPGWLSRGLSWLWPF